MASTENVEKGLRRGDADAALQALLRLPPAERAPFLERTAALFRAAVAADHQAGSWSKLTSWASRAERVPGLAGAAGSAEFLATHWALTWGAVKTKEPERARRWYEPLHAALAEQSPGFAAAMAAVVGGQAAPEAVTPFLEADAAQDSRLGYEPKRQRAQWAPPRTVEDAERAVLAMAAQEPWGVFASAVTDWTPKLEVAVRRVTLELAGALAVRETLRRLASKDARPLAPAELFRHAVEALGAPPALAEEALLLVRLATSQLPPVVDAAASAREFAHAAQAAGAYQALRPLVAATVNSLQFTPEATPPVLRLLDRLLGARAEAGLVGKAMELLANADPTRGDESAYRPSPAVVGALAEVVRVDAPELARWYNELSPPVRGNLSQWMAYVLPVEVVQAFTLAVWPLASAAARRAQLGAVDSVLRRCDESFTFEDEVATPEPWAPATLSPKGRAFWQVVGGLVLPEAPELLPLALATAAPGERLTDILDRAIGPAPTVEHFLSLWEALHEGFGGGQVGPLADHLERALFERHGEDLRAMARGVIAAGRSLVPARLRLRLAEALLALAQGVPETPQLSRALELAGRWAEALGKKRKPRASKPKQKKPRAPKKREVEP